LKKKKKEDEEENNNNNNNVERFEIFIELRMKINLLGCNTV